jgi:hypothetical protein
LASLDGGDEKTMKLGDGKMSMTTVRLACLLAITLAGQVAAMTIDNFDDAILTKLPPGVTRNTVGSSPTVTDTALNGVIGGVRQLTVTATSLLLPSDRVIAGAAVLGDFFDYHSTLTATGEVALHYDRNGLGLNVSVGGFDHFQLTVIDADPASVPYDATVTIADNGSGSASSTQTITTSGPTTIAWPLANFSGVDLNDVRSITLVIAPNSAADMRVDLFQVVSPPPAAPLLSPAMMLGLVVMLGVVGLTTIVRWR